MKAHCVRVVLALALALSITTGSARAEFISGTGILNVSSYNGTFQYTSNSATSATLVVSLTNTTNALFGGYLTSFAFNNPGNQITAVSLSSTDPEFGLIGGPGFGFNNGINAFPHGLFDIGASVGSTFATNTAKGLAPTESATFTFALTGTNLDQINTATFFATNSKPSGLLNVLVEPFVARYRYTPLLTTVVPATAQTDRIQPAQVPEPTALLLAGMGASCLGVTFWRRHRRTRLSDMNR